MSGRVLGIIACLTSCGLSYCVGSNIPPICFMCLWNEVYPSTLDCPTRYNGILVWIGIPSQGSIAACNDICEGGDLSYGQSWRFRLSKLTHPDSLAASSHSTQFGYFAWNLYPTQEIPQGIVDSLCRPPPWARADLISFRVSVLIPWTFSHDCLSCLTSPTDSWLANSGGSIHHLSLN